MKKILNLFSLFFSVISLCAASLVCHIIFIYPNFNNASQKSKNISYQNAPAIQADNAAGENTVPVSAYQDDYPVSDPVIANASDDHQEAAAQPATPPLPDTNDTGLSAEYQSALSKANDYGNIMYMSKAAIYDQLTSDYGERLSPDAAQYAIDNMSADWSFNALQKAKSYSDTMYMSKTAIYDQLISDYGEKFTPSEAQYAIENISADWNYNALQKAKDYQTTMNMSPDAIRDQLVSEYGERFTLEEANYAVANITTSDNTGSGSVLYTVPVGQGNSTNNYIASDPVQATGSQGTNENNFNTYNNSEQPATESNTIVWIDDTAKRYHRKNGCGMDNAYMVTLEVALAKGKTPCGNCYK